MRTIFPATALSVLAIFDCGLMTGCSGSGTPSAGPADAASSADADAGCVRPVWASTDTAFTCTSGGGLPALSDSGCGDQHVQFEFAMDGGRATLAEHGCDLDTMVDRTATLTADATASIITALNQLHTVCGLTSCGADAPYVSLTIGATTYNSDFYSGCGAGSVLPPYVGFDEISGFVYQLQMIVQAACDGDAGDAGTCTLGSADGG
jgi:hypothetical protein